MARQRAQKSGRVSHAAAAIIESSAYGPEPEYEVGTVLTNGQAGEALNWYSYMGDHKEARSYLKDYLIGQGRQDEIRKLGFLPDWALPLTAAWVIRIENRGAKFPTDQTSFIEQKLKDSFKFLPKVEPEVVIQIAERVVDKSVDLIAEIDTALDKRDSEFSVYDFLKERNVTGKVARQIIEYYQPLADELDLAMNKKDVQVVEAYSHLKKPELRQYHDMVKSVIEDAEKFNDVKKASRKPRKKKVKSAANIVQFMKPKDEDKEFKIKSVNPANILGANEVWLFNTVYKTLTVLYAKTDKGLGIHRTAITEYDEEKSVTKRIGRKANLILPVVLNGGKVERRKIIEKVNTDKIQIKDRVSGDVIILRASK